MRMRAWLAIGLAIGGCGGTGSDAPDTADSGTLCGAGTFVAAGQVGTIATSRDGVTWDNAVRLDIAATFDGLVWTGDQFVTFGIRGEVYTSADATSWQRQNDTGLECYDLIWTGADLVAAGESIPSVESLVLRSSDGHGWVSVGTAQPDLIFLAVAEHAGTLVTIGVGPAPEPGAVRPHAIFRYTPSEDWQQVTPWSTEPAGSYEEVIYAKERFVAVGDHVAATSADGATWTAAPIDTRLLSLTWGGGQYVAVGYTDAATSADGSGWSAARFPSIAFPPEITTALEDVAYGNCRYLAVGGPDGFNATSTDGVTWSSSLGPTLASLLKVTFRPD